MQDLSVDLGVFGTGGFQIGQFCCLLVVVERDATFLPGGLALFQGDVVERSTAPQDSIQCLLLFRCWIQPILVLSFRSFQEGQIAVFVRGSQEA